MYNSIQNCIHIGKKSKNEDVKGKIKKGKGKGRKMKKKEEEGLKNVSFWIINSKNKSQRWGNWNGKSARTYQLLCLLLDGRDPQYIYHCARICDFFIARIYETINDKVI